MESLPEIIEEIFSSKLGTANQKAQGQSDGGTYQSGRKGTKQGELNYLKDLLVKGGDQSESLQKPICNVPY